MEEQKQIIEGVAHKIISHEMLQNLSDLIKTFDEVTVARIKEVKEALDTLLLYTKKNKSNKGKMQVTEVDIDSLQKMLNNSDNIALFSGCLTFCVNNKGKGTKKIIDTRDELIEKLSDIQGELFKVTKLVTLGKTNSIVEVISYCYYFKSNPNMIDKVKVLSNNYITTILKLILNEEEFLREEIKDFNYLKNTFSKILKSIYNNSEIIISNELKFYENLKKNYSIEMLEDENNGEKASILYDVVQNVQQNIMDYNNKIIELNDPINIEVKTFLEYLLNTSVDNLEYDKFPSYENVNFLKIISKTRQKLVEENDAEEFPEKLAILDIYHASYYKYIGDVELKYADDSISEKVNKKSA